MMTVTIRINALTCELSAVSELIKKRGTGLMTITIGTTENNLLLKRAKYAASQLEDSRVEVIESPSDIGHNDLQPLSEVNFLRKQLHGGAFDVAAVPVNMLPVDELPGLVIGAVLKREDPADMLVIRKDRLAIDGPFRLLDGAAVCTCSRRCAAQLRFNRPDVEAVIAEAGIAERFERLRAGEYDALMLPVSDASIFEIDYSGLEQVRLDPFMFPPSPGQGAVALLVKYFDRALLRRLLPAINAEATAQVSAERAFLQELGAGCAAEAGAYAVLNSEGLTITGMLTLPDGSTALHESVTGSHPSDTGRGLAVMMKQRADFL